jgi:hypothetical protein
MSLRQPAVAGAFYAGTTEALKYQIERCFLSDLGPKKIPEIVLEGERRIVALISPHAGYMYSGPTASHSYYALASDGKPETFIIIGPNHTGMGAAISMMGKGTWRTPLGDLTIDEQLADIIYEKAKIVERDLDAHIFEHSIEVQLPFLQYLYGSDFKFIPICMKLQDLRRSRILGKGIAEATKGRNVVIIASTDFTHYEPHSQANQKDKLAIDAILKLDEEKLQSIIRAKAITICGPGPFMTAIVAAKELGAKKTKLLSYTTSGEITGDYSAVVGYSAIAILR